MIDFKISNAGTKKMFDNPVLEKLTRTHFLVPIILYTVISAVCVSYTVYASVINRYHILWLYPLGVFSFSLLEYNIHRYIYHFKAETEKEKQLQYNIHGVHHEFPKDKDRLVLPPVLSIVLAIAFYFLFKYTLGAAHLAFYAGFVEGYCVYLLIHYSVHRFRTPKNFLGYLWKHHSIHHYGNCDVAFAVTMPLWDYLFGTMPKTKEDRMQAAGKLPDYNL